MCALVPCRNDSQQGHAASLSEQLPGKHSHSLLASRQSTMQQSPSCAPDGSSPRPAASLHALHSKHVRRINRRPEGTGRSAQQQYHAGFDCAGTCLQELAVDDILDSRADPDHWQPSTFTLKKGSSVFVLPSGTATHYWRRWQTQRFVLSHGAAYACWSITVGSWCRIEHITLPCTASIGLVLRSRCGLLRTAQHL